MTNMLIKVFNWSEVHLAEMTCYKIHTLVSVAVEKPLKLEQSFFDLGMTALNVTLKPSCSSDEESKLGEDFELDTGEFPFFISSRLWINFSGEKIFPDLVVFSSCGIGCINPLF